MASYRAFWTGSVNLDWAPADLLSKAFSTHGPLAIVVRSFGSVTRVYQHIGEKKQMHGACSNGLVPSANYRML